MITVGRGEQCRVVVLDDFPHAELVDHDVRAIFTIEPAQSAGDIPDTTPGRGPQLTSAAATATVEQFSDA